MIYAFRRRTRSHTRAPTHPAGYNLLPRKRRGKVVRKRVIWWHVNKHRRAAPNADRILNLSPGSRAHVTRSISTRWNRHCSAQSGKNAEEESLPLLRIDRERAVRAAHLGGSFGGSRRHHFAIETSSDDQNIITTARRCCDSAAPRRGGRKWMWLREEAAARHDELSCFTS